MNTRASREIFMSSDQAGTADIDQIAIIAPGNMGAGLAARARAAGLRVRTLLAGRSDETRARAEAAGMEDASAEEIAACPLILSVVPPGRARALAEELAPALSASTGKPLFVDCNAVSPDTVKEIGAIIDETGADFADAGIIGLPPRSDGPLPVIYVSGAHAGQVARLNQGGLDIRVLDGPIGAASTLKMCYAGIGKGLTALASAMILAAERAGAGEALRAEMERSQKTLLNRLDRTIPDMFPKAYRWVAEMEEIADFLGDERPESGIYQGMAGFYDRLAHDFKDGGPEIEALKTFIDVYSRPASPRSNG
jgi:putative dehydrogenase